MNSEVSKTKTSRRIGIIQSCYIPWKGYFDFIDSVDEFIVLDEVQYTRRDWRNRNRIPINAELHWLTIPVETKGRYHAPIDAIEVAAHSWIDDHLATLRHAYAGAPAFHTVWPWVLDVYEGLRGLTHLTDVNQYLMRAICARLKITTPIRTSRELQTVEGKNERLIALCLALGGSEYLSGPAARAYMDVTTWRDAGIEVLFKSYSGYPQYSQSLPTFEHGVSIVDVLFQCGDNARQFIKSATDVEPT